jgi:hypothetical protein
LATAFGFAAASMKETGLGGRHVRAFRLGLSRCAVEHVRSGPQS